MQNNEFDMELLPEEEVTEETVQELSNGKGDDKNELQ
jgi:hypothetical protein